MSFELADLSVLLVTEPPETLRRFASYGRGSAAKLARQTEPFEIWKRTSHAIDFLSQLLSGPAPFQSFIPITTMPAWLASSSMR